MAEKIRNEASSSTSNNRGESVVVDVGRRKSSCGYCKSGGRTSIAHGLWVHSITVDDYQDLLDQGWRRSGSFLYKPEMERTCCPSYTIRLKAGDFIHSKEQLRVSRRMQRRLTGQNPWNSEYRPLAYDCDGLICCWQVILRFLDGALDASKSNLWTDVPSTSIGSAILASDGASSPAAKEPSAGNCEEQYKEEQYIYYLSNQIDNAVHTCTESGEFPSDIQLPKASVKKVTHAKRKLIEGSEDLLYSSNISFQIAAAVNRSRSAEKNASSNHVNPNVQYFELSPKIVAEKLACSLNQLANFSDLSIIPCNGHLNFYSATRKVSSGVGVVTASQSTRGYGGKHSYMEKYSKHPQQERRKLEIRLKRSCFDPEEYDLYRRYQIKVHNDTPDQVMESSYKRFLVDTPIVFVPPSGDSTVPPCGFGSFHQQYVIDGRLVAVGVVDILPRCLSSKYLFWDPDLAFLSLGKYSALQEIGWVKEKQVHCPSLQYYYLGYYIHSCSKMRYKAAYRPSELLCPLRYQWVPFDIAKPLLDKSPYAILSNFSTLQNCESSRCQLPVKPIEPQHHDPRQDDSCNILSDEDEEMAEPDFEESDNDSGPETSGLTSGDEIKVGDAGNVLIGLRGLRLRFKDIQGGFDPAGKNYLELQLHRYMKAVGPALSEHMVYSLD